MRQCPVLQDIYTSQATLIEISIKRRFIVDVTKVKINGSLYNLRLKIIIFAKKKKNCLKSTVRIL